MLFFFMAALIQQGCESSLNGSELVEHPLDKVPIGCIARRVSEHRWEVACDDADQADEFRDHGVVDPEDFSVIRDFELSSDLAQRAPDEAGVNHIDIGQQQLDQDFGEDMTISQDFGRSAPCDPPLSIISPASAVRPLNLVPLSASGGSGAWHFELIESGSGAIINAETGAYLAGSQVGAEDLIRLTDLHCSGEATFRIRVVAGLQVAPREATLQPGD